MKVHLSYHCQANIQDYRKLSLHYIIIEIVRKIIAVQ